MRQLLLSVSFVFYCILLGIIASIFGYSIFVILITAIPPLIFLLKTSYHTIFFDSYVYGFFKDSNILSFNVAKNFCFYNIRIYNHFYEYKLSDITKIICEKEQYIVPESRTQGDIDHPRHIVFKDTIKLVMKNKKIIINLFSNSSRDPFAIDLGQKIHKFLNVEYIVKGHHYYNSKEIHNGSRTYYN